MNSSSVYSIGDSLYKKATQFYNDYISRDQNEKLVQDMLQEINDGEIIFSKNNVCIHLNEPSYRSTSSTAACGKNCLPGYFSIKLIKCQPDSSDVNQSTKQSAKPHREVKIEETSFIENERFELENVISKDENSLDTEKNDLNSEPNRTNTQKRTSSVYLKQQETNSIKNASIEPHSPFYSMIITWISNLIFEEKPNKLTRNLSLKSTNSTNRSFSQPSKRRLKSLSNLDDHTISHTMGHNLINSRSYASDTQLNLVSKSFNTFRSRDDLISNEDSLIFQIDIKKIKSLKLFFGSQTNQNDDEFNQIKDGQLVIGTYDLQYKIFHFHNGGISRLCQFLDDWNFVFFKQKNLNSGFLSFFEHLYEESNQFGDPSESLVDFYMNKFVQLKYQKQLQHEYNNNEISCIQLYSINLPALDYLDLQNEYSTYEPLTINLQNYNQFFSSDGLLVYDFEKLKLRCFFKGCESNSRRYFWPYLLNRFSPNLTSKEKNEIKKHGEFLYLNIDEKRRNLKKDDKFYRKFIQYQSTIREDVPRTDRNNKALKGKSKQMERILLNYTLYSTRLGYTQGSSSGFFCF